METNLKDNNARASWIQQQNQLYEGRVVTAQDGRQQLPRPQNVGLPQRGVGQKPKAAERMSKTRVLAMANTLKRGLVVVSIVSFGAFGGLAALHQVGTTSSQSTQSSSTSSQSNSTSNSSSQNDNNFLNQQGGNTSGTTTSSQTTSSTSTTTSNAAPVTGTSVS